MRRIRKRWFVFGAVCLVFGFAISVGVALVAARYQTVDTRRGLALQDVDEAWVYGPPSAESWPDRVLERGRASVPGYRRVEQVAYGPDMSDAVLKRQERFGLPAPERIRAPRRKHRLILNDYGWPLKCMRVARFSAMLGFTEDGFRPSSWEQYVPDDWRRGVVVDPGGVRGGAIVSPVVLPTNPLVVAQIGNAVFYGAVLMSPIVVCAWMRAHRRRKRGLCVRCGYDLKGVDGASVCPECGAGVS